MQSANKVKAKKLKNKDAPKRKAKDEVNGAENVKTKEVEGQRCPKEGP